MAPVPNRWLSALVCFSFVLNLLPTPMIRAKDSAILTSGSSAMDLHSLSSGSSPVTAEEISANSTSSVDALSTVQQTALSCDLYPIALHAQTLAAATPGAIIGNILNGSQPGNFGWLTWNGANSTPTLVASLTQPGNAYTYANPADATDHLVSLENWVKGNPGVSNSSAVRTALNLLKTVDISVPVWDTAVGDGAGTLYHVTAFALVRIIDYRLAAQNRITVRFLRYNRQCGDNFAPIAADDSYQVNEDTVLRIRVPGVLTNDSDANEQVLSADLLTNPTHGSLSFEPTGSFIYTPTADFNGLDHFTYQASDGLLTSNVATATITIKPVNDPPQAVDDRTTTDEDNAVVIFARANDLAGPPNEDQHLTITEVGDADHGVASLTAAGDLRYTPTLNFNGIDRFPYTACDSENLCATAEVTVIVNAVNDPPIARNDQARTAEDTPLTFNVAANDADPDGNLLPATVATTSDPRHGTVTTTGDGHLTYHPHLNANGIDTFGYTICDDGEPEGVPLCAGALITVEITPVNDAPVAENNTYTTNEDVLLTIVAPGLLGNDTDVDGDPLTIDSFALPDHGTLTLNATGAFVYRPTPDFNGVDTFTYQAGDGVLSSNIATATITVQPVNDPPHAADDNAIVDEDAAVVVDVRANDNAGPADEDQTLTITIVGDPQNGTATHLATGDIRYTPDPNYNGTDHFVYTICDTGDLCADAEVAIVIGGLNDQPDAQDDSVSTPEDSAVTIDVAANDSDVDNNLLAGTAVTLTNPTIGTLSTAGDGRFLYTPTPNQFGIDTFRYMICDDGAPDGTALCDSATVTIIVTPVNDDPVVRSDTYPATEDTQLTVSTPGLLANDNDIDGDSVTIDSFTQPSHGILIQADTGAFTYQPSANFCGTDSYTYSITDGHGALATADVTIIVNCVNDAPLAQDNQYSTPEDQPLVVNAPGILDNDSDVEDDALTVSHNTPPSHGQLAIAPAGSFVYTPTVNYCGADSYTYTVADGNGGTAIAGVTITVHCTNDQPVPVADAYTTDEDTLLTVAAPGLLGNDRDIDGDPLSVAQASQPAHGLLTPKADGSFTYQPAPNYCGTDAYTYTVADGNDGLGEATVTLTILCKNDPPIAQEDGFILEEDTALTLSVTELLANDLDPDGDALDITGYTQPTHGLLTRDASGAFVYIPATNFCGIDSYSYTITDGNEESATATVLLDIACINDPPVLHNATVETAANSPVIIAVLLTDRDVDGDQLTVTAVTQPAHGSAVINLDQTVTYTPTADFAGIDSFTYTVCDPAQLCATGTVTVDVAGANAAPLAIDDNVSTLQATTIVIDVTTNDSDPDANLVITSVVALTAPLHGELLDLSEGRFVYTPAAGFSGVDTFTYQICDDAGACAIATVTITVTPDTPPGPKAGILLGEVYNDAVGLPLAGATVQVLTLDGVAPDPAIPTVTSDALGRYHLNTQSGLVRLRISKPGFTTVERQVQVIGDSGIAAFDARLTPLAEPTTVRSITGGTVATQATDLQLTVAPLALNADQAIGLTQISGQGLAGRLPAGWSPVIAAEVSPRTLAGSVTLVASIPPELPADHPLIAVSWHSTTGRWLTLGTVTRTDTELSFELAQGGQVVFLLADAPPHTPPPPIAGQPLTGVEPGDLPANLNGEILPSPRVLVAGPDTHAQVTVHATAAISLTSGIPFQIGFAEQYVYLSGETASPEPMTQDFTLYAFPGGARQLQATFIASPSRPVSLSTLKQGLIDLALYLPASFASPSDNIIGVAGGTLSTAEGATLHIPANAVENDLPVVFTALTAADVADTLPSQLNFVGGVTLDLHGVDLQQPATLTMPAPTGLDPNLPILVARLSAVGNGSYWVLVAMATLQNGQLVSTVDPTGDGTLPLAGLRSGGRYAFFAGPVELGYVTGAVRYADGLALTNVLVTGVAAGAAAVSAANGRYALAVPVGAAQVTAVDSITLDSQQAELSVPTPGAVVNHDFTLTPTPPTVLAVEPADGAEMVPLTAVVKVTFSKPIDPATMTATALTVADATGPLAGVRSVTPGNRVVTFQPQSLLTSQTNYTVTVTTAVEDLNGRALPAAVVTHFSTEDQTPPPVPPAGQISASIPDADGFTVVAATPGTVEPDLVVTVRNITSSTLTTIAPEADGSFTVRIAAALSSKLDIILTDSAGNRTIVPVPPFRDDEGRVVIGAEGGQVDGPEGLFVEIPPATVADGTLVKVDAAMITSFTLPLPSGFSFIGAMDLQLQGATPSEPLDVGIRAPADATATDQVLVVREVKTPHRQGWMVMDRAHLRDGHYVTSSPPFVGVPVEGRYAFLRSEGDCVSYVAANYRYQHQFTLIGVGTPFLYVQHTIDVQTGIAVLPAVCSQPLTIATYATDTDELIQEITQQAPADRDTIVTVAQVLNDDRTAPTIVASQLPVTIGDPLHEIRLRFSEPMAIDSVVNNWRLLQYDAAGNETLVTGYVEVIESNTVALFRPDLPLRLGRAYTILLDGAIDLVGNPLAGTQIPFHTAPPQRQGQVPSVYGEQLGADDIAAIGDTLFIARRQPNTLEQRIVAVDISDPSAPREIGSDIGILELTAIATVADAGFVTQDGVSFSGDLLLAVGGRSDIDSKLKIYDVTPCTQRPVSGANCLLGATLSTKYLTDPQGIRPPSPMLPREAGAPRAVSVLHQANPNGSDVVLVYVATVPIGLQAVNLAGSFGNPAPDALLRGSYSAVTTLKDRVLAVSGIRDPRLFVLSAQLSPVGDITLPRTSRVGAAANVVFDLDRDDNLGAAEDGDGDTFNARDELFDLAVVTGGRLGELYIVDMSPQTDLRVASTHQGSMAILSRIPVPTALVRSVALDAQAKVAYVELESLGLAVIDLSHLEQVILGARSGDGLWDSDGDNLDDRILTILPKSDVNHGHTVVIDPSRTGVYVNGSASGVDLYRPGASSALDLIVETPLRLQTTVDRINEQICPSPTPSLQFTLNQPAKVTIRIDGAIITVDGIRQEHVDFLAGPSSMLLPPAAVNSLGVHEFTITAVTDPANPLDEVSASGQIVHDLKIHEAFPIGHTMVKGVDLWDGHLTHGTQDIAVPGRGLSLEFNRSYSSAGHDLSGPLGAGWSHSYDIQLAPDDCGRYVVRGGEGTGNAFTNPHTDPLLAARFGVDNASLFFDPQIGYHSTLIHTPDGAFDFFTKAHVRYHFERDGVATGERYLLQYIEEPNGNRITLTYRHDMPSATAVVSTVADSAGRALIFEYDYIVLAPRLTKLTAQVGSGLDIVVTYTYDQWGNLVNASRQSPFPSAGLNDGWTESYTYNTASPIYQHQLLSYTDPNGHTTSYRYGLISQVATGQITSTFVYTNGNGGIVLGIDEPAAVTTNFTYDFAANTRSVTDPRDPAGNTIPPTVYTLNRYGAVVRIDEPLGKRTIMEWCTDRANPNPACPDRNGNPGVDALMVRKIDAEGRTHLYEYGDGLGNLTKETIRFTNNKAPVTRADGSTVVAEIVTTSTYDLRYNKLTSRTDTEGNTTTYLIDGTTGNLLELKDAEDNRTQYSYYPNGDLKTVTDPRGFVTTYTSYDAYGNPTQIKDPLGNITTNQYDARSRLVERYDTFSHHLLYRYDGLDRKLREEQRDDLGDGGATQVTEYRYAANGEIATQTDGLGQVTRYLYDDLNRLVEQREEGVIQADGSSTTLRTLYAYDEANNLIRETSPRGIVHTHTYDELNRHTASTIDGAAGPNLTTFAAAYDLVGNKLSESDHHGYTTDFVYDGLYRLVETRLPFSHDFTDLPQQQATLKIAYDRVGNKVLESDANGYTSHYTYDRIYRLLTQTDADGNQVHFTYDRANNKVREEQLSSGLTVAYRYDGLNRTQIMTQTVPLGAPGLQPAVYLTRYTYEDSDNAVTVTNPRGFKSRTDKDGLDRVYQTVVDTDGLALATTFTYDANGNLQTLRDPQTGDVDVTHSYDGLNRKISSLYVSTPGDGGAIRERFFYDGDNNLIRQIDKRGIEFTWSYDNLARERTKALKETLSNGGALLILAETQYEDQPAADGRYRVITFDANRNQTITQYDSLDRPTVIDDPDANGLLRYSYDGVNKRTEIDKNGQRTAFTYDAINRLVATAEHDAGDILRTTLQASYEDEQNRVVETDRRGVQSITQNDALGRLRQHKRAGLDMTTYYGANELLLESYDYDGNGNQIAFVDGQGNRTEWIYDSVDRQVRQIEGAGSAVAATTLYTYDRANNLLTVKDGRNHGGAFDMQYRYDARYRQVSATNGEGETTTYRYDGNNNLIQLTEPNGAAHTTHYRYDEFNQLLAVDETPRTLDGAAAGVTRFFYDGNRNKIAQQDANGNLTTYRYDSLNRLTATFQHTVAGALTATTTRGGDPAGGDFYAATGGNEATALHWRYGYDGNGNQTLIVDARGQRVTMAYDHLDRLVRKQYSDHAAPDLPFQVQAIDYTYDGNSNITAITETKTLSGALVLEFTASRYDPLDRLQQRTHRAYDESSGKSIGYSYDIQGNRTQITDADGLTTTYSYDARNRLATVTTASGVTTYHWWEDNLLKQVIYPNQTLQDRSGADAYDRADRVLHIVNGPVGPAIPYSTFVYTYDDNGNRLQQIETQKALAGGAPETTTYTYDNLNRVRIVGYGTAGQVSYTYAPNGNRLTEQGIDPVSGTPIDRTYQYAALADRPGLTYDHVNALTRIVDNLDPSQTITYEYDANLNQTAKQQAGERTSYHFEIRDQLAVAEVAGVHTRFDYDSNRMRVKKIAANGDETRYLYDENAVLQEYGGAAAGLATIHKYEYGYELLALTQVEVGGARSSQFYLTDALMSTANLSDAAGDLVHSYRYDAWGRVRDQLGASTNSRRYTGHYYDDETGLHYFGARYYDDEIGRFLSQDPYLGEANTPPSLHRYLYAYANPLRYVDLLGYLAKDRGSFDDSYFMKKQRALNKLKELSEQRQKAWEGEQLSKMMGLTVDGPTLHNSSEDLSTNSRPLLKDKGKFISPPLILKRDLQFGLVGTDITTSPPGNSSTAGMQPLYRGRVLTARDHEPLISNAQPTNLGQSAIDISDRKNIRNDKSEEIVVKEPNVLLSEPLAAPLASQGDLYEISKRSSVHAPYEPAHPTTIDAFAESAFEGAAASVKGTGTDLLDLTITNHWQGSMKPMGEIMRMIPYPLCQLCLAVSLAPKAYSDAQNIINIPQAISKGMQRYQQADRMGKARILGRVFGYMATSIATNMAVGKVIPTISVPGEHWLDRLNAVTELGNNLRVVAGAAEQANK